MSCVNYQNETRRQTYCKIYNVRKLVSLYERKNCLSVKKKKTSNKLKCELSNNFHSLAHENFLLFIDRDIVIFD